MAYQCRKFEDSSFSHSRVMKTQNKNWVIWGWLGSSRGWEIGNAIIRYNASLPIHPL